MKLMLYESICICLTVLVKNEKVFRDTELFYIHQVLSSQIIMCNSTDMQTPNNDKIH